MSTFDHQDESEKSSGYDDSWSALHSSSPIAVRSCNRIGLQASPPGISLTSWFRRR